MWLITTLVAACGASLGNIFLSKKYKFNILAFMLWGAVIMILVDHILGYEGGNFLEIETDGIIKNGLLLGLVMVIFVILFWFGTILFSNLKRR